MNAYEIEIWRGVDHNGKFSHNVHRVELIHALSTDRALQKIELDPAKTKSVNGLTIEVSPEFVYAIRKTGTVTIQRMYVYSDGRSPRLVTKRTKK